MLPPLFSMRPANFFVARRLATRSSVSEPGGEDSYFEVAMI